MSINYKNSCYVDSVIGIDSLENSNIVFKTISFAKNYLSENKVNNGVIYLKDKYTPSQNDELVSEIPINIIGLNDKAEIYHVSTFGDNISIIKNISFYKLKISYGESRIDYHPTFNGNMYNCIVTVSGSMAMDYINFYNCIFTEALSNIGYRSSEDEYVVHGKYINCIFNDKVYNEETSYRKIKEDNKYNLFTSDIEKYLNIENREDELIKHKGDSEIKNRDGSISDIGIFGGLYPFIFLSYVIELDNKYYTLENGNTIKKLKNNLELTEEYFKNNGFTEVAQFIRKLYSLEEESFSLIELPKSVIKDKMIIHTFLKK